MAIADVRRAPGKPRDLAFDRRRGISALPDDVAEPGHALNVRWASAVGATRAVLDAAPLSLAPAVVRELAEDVPFQMDGDAWVVTIPAGKRLRALTLHGLERDGGGELTNSGELGALRLVLSFPAPQGGWESPRFAVPSVEAVKLVPRTLTGAGFSQRVLSLSTSVVAERLRLALVSGGSPPEFTVLRAALERIDLTTEAAAHDLAVRSPEGDTLWAVPVFEPDAPAVAVDLRFALERTFDAQLKSGAALDATFSVSAKPPAQAFVQLEGVRGALLRVHEGVLRSQLGGDPVPLALPMALADETPASARGGLSLRYAGVRLLASLSDAVPGAADAVSGHIVGDAPVVRAFPPAAFEGITLARVGIIGRAPEDCELALEFVALAGGLPGAPLGPPALLRLGRDARVATRWAELPEGLGPSGPVGLRVRANRGRFFWAGLAAPLVRLAIHDPDPGGRALRLAGVPIAALTESASHAMDFDYPASVFRGAAPTLESELFLTVDVSDLTLRYSR